MGLWQPMYMNAAFTNSVMNLCKRLNLIPVCTNTHKYYHPLFYVFVAQIARWEQHFICNCLQCADMTSPSATPVLQESSAKQRKQLTATGGFPKWTYMSSSKRIMWTVNTQFWQCHYLMKASSQNHHYDNNSHKVGGIYLQTRALKELFSSVFIFLWKPLVSECKQKDC